MGSGAVLDAAIGAYRGKGGDEQTLLRQILDTLKTGDVLLGDAYFATYSCSAICWKKELMRSSNNTARANAAPTFAVGSVWENAII